LIRASLSTARANWSHLFDHAKSRAVPGNNGAPRSSVSAADTWRNYYWRCYYYYYNLLLSVIVLWFVL